MKIFQNWTSLLFAIHMKVLCSVILCFWLFYSVKTQIVKNVKFSSFLNSRKIRLALNMLENSAENALSHLLFAFSAQLRILVQLLGVVCILL